MNLGVLIFESCNLDMMDLDMFFILEMLICINDEDRKVFEVICLVIFIIVQVVDLVVKVLWDGGWLIYFGVGISGWFGVLDVLECLLIFGVFYGRVIGLIVGGFGVLFKVVEGVEDDVLFGEWDL